MSKLQTICYLFPLRENRENYCYEKLHCQSEITDKFVRKKFFIENLGFFLEIFRQISLLLEIPLFIYYSILF